MSASINDLFDRQLDHVLAKVIVIHTCGHL